MAEEFVSIDEHGIERDWIDPVVSVTETVTDYHVDNGYHIYDVPKTIGWTYLRREKVMD